MHIWKRTSGKFEQILFNKFITTIKLFGITSMIVEFLFWIPTWTFSWRVWDSTVSMSSSSTTRTKWTYISSSSSCRDPLVTTLQHASIKILEPVGNQIQSERTQDHLRDSYCQIHKSLARPSDCGVDWAWLDQIWRKNFAIKVESIGPYYEQKTR